MTQLKFVTKGPFSLLPFSHLGTSGIFQIRPL